MCPHESKENVELRLGSGVRPMADISRAGESRASVRLPLSRSWTSEQIATKLGVAVDELPADFLVQLRANGAFL